jgi:hypothetical protein
MTAKEKAKELFNKFINANSYSEEYVVGQYDIVYSLDKLDAKECALICVNEIIDIIRELANEDLIGIYLLYYENVKKEIELL